MGYFLGRPLGRLCCWVVVAVLLAGGAVAEPQSGATTTSVADIVYMADGTPAAGTLIISWPAFLTAGWTAVAAGSTNVTLAVNGGLNVSLVANVGASPAGVYYSVIYQLGPGEVKTEYWLVPASTAPVNLATVRTTPGSGVATQPVSMQYVNSQLATKANDSAVVHLGGTETIAGGKTFSVSPSVPTPTSSTSIASKGYVDTAISNVGVGNYLPTAGGTMTGPITLPANPAAAMQASTKQYVDTGLAAKSDLIAGLVPANELGTGLASTGSCLLGNGASGSWGSCASGSGGLSVNPAGSQAIAQPAGTQFSANNLANIRYVTASWNWAQTPADNLGTAGSNTIHLSPCPLGIDTTSSTNYYSYKVYIAGTGIAESVPVTGGSCAPGAGSGTITVTTKNAHAAGYTVGSASTGIQEAWNDAWTNDQGVSSQAQTAPYVKLAAAQQYNVYATVYLRGRGGILDGAGALMVCSTRDRCIYVGTTQGVPYVNQHKLYNLSGTSSLNVDGVQVASVSATSGSYTLTTVSAHPFVVGDVVDCEYYSTTAGQHWTSAVVSVPNSTSFKVNLGNATFSAGTGMFGFCNLLNAFLENNSDHVVLQDINLFQSNPAGMGYFSFGIVNDNDQQFIIERAANRASVMINATANWPLGAFIYQRTDQGNAGIIYLHDSEITGVNCATGGGNGVVITDTVCQGFPTYGVRYFGGLQPATFQNIYQESTGATANPLYGYAAQTGFLIQGGMGSKILGTFPINGYDPGFATGGGSSAERTYFVVPRSSTQGYGPVLYAGWAEPASGTTNVQVMWPSVEMQSSLAQSLGTLTWDVLVTTGVGTTAPFGTGSYAIATNVSGNCGTSGMCSFTDTQVAAGSYTVQAQQFTPVFWFWPVSIVLNGTTVLMEQAGANPSAVASQGTTGISIVAQQCKSVGASQRRSPIWVSCLASETGGGAGSIATLLQQVDPANNGPAINSKGRVNFGRTINPPNDFLTLQDSNFSKTLATAGGRPGNDAGDMAIGVDQAGGLAERAANSISSYIGTAPNSGATNFLERLTAAGKTVNVPVTVNGNLAVAGGTVTLPMTGTGPQCLHVSSMGVVSGTGADCGSGGGGGSGTVGAGSSSQLAMYAANGTAVSGDSALTDSGSLLSYSGTGGISATGATFSGNITVGGQVIMTGPWLVNTPVPGTAMGTAASGTSSMGISNDGNFYISANAGAPSKVLTAGSDAVPTVFGRAGAVTAAAGDYTCGQVTGCTLNTTTVNGHALTGNVTVSAADINVGTLPHSQLPALVSGDIPNNAANTTGTAGSLMGGALGAIPYQASSGTTAMLAGNTGASDQVLTSTGTGTAAQTPTLKNAPALNAANMTGFPNTLAGVSPAGSLATGDYVVAAGYASTTDSGVLAGPYAIPWITAVRGGVGATFAANVVKMWGVVLTFPVKTTYLTYNVVAADNTANNYDVGIATATGTIVLDIGATAGTSFAPAVAPRTIAWAQGTKVLQPGKYYIVVTTNCASSCATISADSSVLGVTFQNAATAGTTSGGALTGFTPPADVWSWGASIPALVVK